MSRMTITLDDAYHSALKETATLQHKTIGQLIRESLDFYGIKPRQDAQSIVAQARQHANLGDDAAMQLALAETAAARQ